jgi:hypothetical protein
MKHQKILLLITSFFFFTNAAVAAVQNSNKKPNDEQKLLEELTGKKAVAAKPAITLTASAKAAPAVAANERPVSRKLLDAGFYAFTKKDYISALKHYNTIIVKHPKSNELQLAYLGKSKLYNEMGLIEQAKLNLQIANQIGKKSKLAK